MYVEIVTPEAVLYRGKVTAISVPSIKGPFQLLENHAPIIAVLGKGEIKLKGSSKTEIFVEERFEEEGKDTFVLSINGGTIEQKENRAIILAE